MDTADAIQELERYREYRQTTLATALSQHELVGVNYDPVNGSYIVMAERDPGVKSGTVSIRELGYSSPSPWTAWTREERVGVLRDRVGIRTYYDMKRADGSVRGALRALKTPILSARWFVEPASQSAIDIKIAEFVADNLFKRMNVPWSRTLEDMLLMCEYGYFPMEKVYKFDSDGKVRIAKLAPRHPLDIREWIYDDNGGPDGLIMDYVPIEGFTGDIFIPISKMVVFVLEQEGGDLRGISILRSAYKHYYYKDNLYKIDAIQKERHGIGVPIIRMPLGFTDDDKSMADDLGRNLRTNERAHITIPNNWEVEFAKLEGQPVDCMTSIKHHDDKIWGNILAPFYDDPDAKEDSMGLFYKSTRYIANTITDTINAHCIPQLVDYNFARGGYPQLKARRIGEWEDIRTMSFAFRNFVGAGGIIPDDKLEAFLRVELDLPQADPSTARVMQTPQKPEVDEAGLPRQKTSPPVGSGKGNSGTDRSGGE